MGSPQKNGSQYVSVHGWRIKIKIDGPICFFENLDMEHMGQSPSFFQLDAHKYRPLAIPTCRFP